MKTTVAFLACLGVAAASICCVPPQWTAGTLFLTTIVHNGKATISRGRTAVAYDGINKKIGVMEEIEVNGKMQLRLGVLQDYNSNTKYIVNSDGSCMKTTLNRTPMDFGGCVPDNATVLATDAVYGFGTNVGKVNSYRLEYPGIIVDMSLTADACVPVAESIRGQLEGNYFLENQQYFNVTPGIAMPERLAVPPKGCENARTVPAHYTGSGYLPLGSEAGIGRIFFPVR